MLHDLTELGLPPVLEDGRWTKELVLLPNAALEDYRARELYDATCPQVTVANNSSRRDPVRSRGLPRETPLLVSFGNGLDTGKPILGK